MASKRNKGKVQERTAQGQSKLWLIVGVGVGLLLLAIGAGMLLGQGNGSGYVPEVAGAPNVVVNQEVVDYGDVKLDTTIETVFKVKNTGSEVLRILDNEPQVELVQGC